jgi:fructokinase
MRRIFGLGETVFDIIFKNRQPVASRPGGSAFNALVSLARVGHQVHLISEIGKDDVGEGIVKFLDENHVNTNWLHRFSTGQTPVALAFLDENNNAGYQVYKDFPDVRFQVSAPDFEEGDILLFGSFFAVNPVIRSLVVSLLKKAREQGAYLIYDPNFRKNHSRGLNVYRPIIEENFSLANLVRGSDEDFQTIYGDLTINESLEKVKSFEADAIVTANANGVYCSVAGADFHVPSKDIEPVSTIGAGDNFNAGLAHGIHQYGGVVLGEEEWQRIVECAVAFSTDVCLSFDNYVSKEFATSLVSCRI